MQGVGSIVTTGVFVPLLYARAFIKNVNGIIGKIKVVQKG